MWWGGGLCERQEEDDRAESALLLLQSSDQTVLTADRGRDGVPIENSRELLNKFQPALVGAARQLGAFTIFPAGQSCLSTVSQLFSKTSEFAGSVELRGQSLDLRFYLQSLRGNFLLQQTPENLKYVNLQLHENKQVHTYSSAHTNMHKHKQRSAILRILRKRAASHLQLTFPKTTCFVQTAAFP